MMFPFAIGIITWQKGDLVQPLRLLPAIFLYLYLRSFKERITWRKALPHLLIFCIFFFPVYWNVSSLTTKYPDTKIPSSQVLYNPVAITIQMIRICLQIFYYFLSRRTVISYQKSIQHLFSETSRINLFWAKVLVNANLFLVIAGIIIFLLMLRYPEHFNLLLLINVAIGAPYIYMATYKGVMQPTIWQVQPGINKETVEEEMHEAEEIEIQIINHEKPKPSKAGLSEDKIGEIVKKIIALVEHEKLYQETELILQQLAGKLQLPTYQISQAINEGMKKNFYDLVNGYRVEEAKRLLLDPKSINYTILSVGFEAGFNSKTTFNTVFKKFTGLTPSDFKVQQRVGLTHV